MGLFDTVKKFVAGDVAHDAADSGNPVKMGGKARSTLPTAVAANDRVDAYLDVYGRQVIASGLADDADTTSLVVNGLPLGGIYRTDDNVFASGVTEANARAAALRMSRERELLVVARSLGARYDSSVVTARGTLISVTSMTAGYAVPVANDFSGSAAWTSTAARFLKIPMRYFTNGITLGIYQNLGSAVSLEIHSEIVDTATPTANFILHRSAISIASGAFVYIQPYTLDATAGANIYALPSLLMPMHSLILKLTAASAPTSGQLMLYLNR